jgi:hypothetical protein
MMTLKEVIEEAQEEIKRWPLWMQNAARFEGWTGLEHLRKDEEDTPV